MQHWRTLMAVIEHRHSTVRALSGAVAAIVLPIAAIVALHRLGSVEWLRIDFGDLEGWTRRSRPEDAFAAVLRYVALAGAYWLAATSLLYLLARLSGAARLIDATAVLTLPAVRRVTDRLVVGTLAVSSLAGPAIGLSGPWSGGTTTVDPIASRLQADDAERPDIVIDLGAIEQENQSTPGLRPVPPLRPVPSVEGPAHGENPASERPPETISITAGTQLEVIVTEGDHLWSLAERRVSDVLGRPAADHEVAPYWREVVSSNPEIRSGDPDVIYPGEVIVLPPMP